MLDERCIFIIQHEQNLGTVFICYSLGFFLKILTCDFFLIDGTHESIFFKLSSHMTEF